MAASMASLRDAVYGAAVGDALGVPYEFRARGTFECNGMAGHGTHNQPAGTFSDDTSMILATCDSIRAKRGKVDVADMRSRFEAWAYRGEYAVGGRVFDIGTTVSTALAEGEGRTGERSNGNGSLMRIVPLAFTDASDDEVRAVSAITHAHRTSTEACVVFVRIARCLAQGAGINEAVNASCEYGGKTWRALYGIGGTSRDDIASGGYVRDTLRAAIWCIARNSDYDRAVLAAVNLGGDTDTTACVAGALAGIMYGYEDIPPEWLETLRGRDIIERCLF